MNQSDRIKLILEENNLKQKQLAAEIGITESYVSMLVKKPEIKLSQSLAALIEEKYGYYAEWVLRGTLPKRKQVSQDKTLSEVHQQAIRKLERMSEAQAKAVLAFIGFLEEVEQNTYR